MEQSETSSQIGSGWKSYCVAKYRGNNYTKHFEVR